MTIKGLVTLVQLQNLPDTEHVLPLKDKEGSHTCEKRYCLTIAIAICQYNAPAINERAKDWLRASRPIEVMSTDIF